MTNLYGVLTYHFVTQPPLRALMILPARPVCWLSQFVCVPSLSASSIAKHILDTMRHDWHITDREAHFRRICLLKVIFRIVAQIVAAPRFCLGALVKRPA
jgi:hypothetical protein